MTDRSAPPAITLGWATAVTLTFTFVILGATMQVALAEAGTSPVRAWIASATIFSATSQFAYLAVRSAGGTDWAAILAGLVVATRFGILAASLAPRLPEGRWRRAAAAVCTLDPGVAMAVQQPTPEAVERQYWLTSACLVGGWFVGITIGSVLGDVIGDTARYGVDAVFPAVLLAMIGNALRTRDGFTAAVAGGLISMILVPVTPAGVPIILSVAGVAVAIAAQRGRS